MLPYKLLPFGIYGSANKTATLAPIAPSGAPSTLAALALSSKPKPVSKPLALQQLSSPAMFASTYAPSVYVDNTGRPAAVVTRPGEILLPDGTILDGITGETRAPGQPSSSREALEIVARDELERASSGSTSSTRPPASIIAEALDVARSLGGAALELATAPARAVGSVVGAGVGAAGGAARATSSAVGTAASIATYLPLIALGAAAFFFFRKR